MCSWPENLCKKTHASWSIRYLPSLLFVASVLLAKEGPTGRICRHRMTGSLYNIEANLYFYRVTRIGRIFSQFLARVAYRHGPLLADLAEILVGEQARVWLLMIEISFEGNVVHGSSSLKSCKNWQSFMADSNFTRHQMLAPGQQYRNISSVRSDVL